jgi:hypothetical protein
MLRARLAAATGAPFGADAGAALACFRSVRAPWWEAKALALVGRAG